MRDLPTRINGYPVMAVGRTPAGKGEFVDQGVVIVDSGNAELGQAETRFVVWYIASNPGFQDGAWQAMNGYYSLTWPRALELFAERMKSNQDVPWDRVFDPQRR